MPGAPAYVFDFTQGSKDQKDLLGGKGANLAEMTQSGAAGAAGVHDHDRGVPVVPGEREGAGRAAGAGHDGAAAPGGLPRPSSGRSPRPAAGVSVRSGAKFSMPGMMETVLNIGLNDASVVGLAEASGDERFAWDSYRRLIQMFGKTVLDIDGERFARGAGQGQGGARVCERTSSWTSADLQSLVQQFKDVVREESGRDFPQHPREQLDLAIRAVFDSWNTDRARLYRRRERIPHDLGTAVNICTMVFGNLGTDSGTGVAFTRDPPPGAPGAYGDYLPTRRARTSSPGSGTR